MSNFKQAFFNLFAQAAGAAIVMACLYFAETRFFPIVSDFEVHQIQKTSDGYAFSGSLNKTRACEFIGLTVYGITADGRKAVMYQFRNDIFGANVGVGQQDWGPVLIPVLDKRYLHAKIMGTHRCHPMWLQTTVYATIDLPRQ